MSRYQLPGRDDEDDSYVPDENDPDYRYSEVHGYSNWEPREFYWLKPVLIAISVFVLIAMLLPLVLGLAGAFR